jgi:hypothetical protein
MATNYPANSSAAQAPSPAPSCGGQPIASLPADADGWTVANFYQALKAAFDWLYFFSKMMAGLLTAKSIVLSAAGGTVAGGGTPGTVTPALLGAGLATPTPTITIGALYGEDIPCAYLFYEGASDLFRRGKNIDHVVRNSAGDYTIFLITPIDQFTAIVQCTANTNSFIPSWKAFANAANQITVKVYNDAGVAVDAPISVTVWAKA